MERVRDADRRSTTYPSPPAPPSAEPSTTTATKLSTRSDQAHRDGTRVGILKCVTHDPPRGVIVLYSEFSWEDFCRAVKKLQVTLPGPG